MNKIKKLLRKISKNDRDRLRDLLAGIVNGDKKIKTVKIKNTDFFRVRFGKFRIIFHHENKEVIIDSVKLRNEKTYKNL